MEASNGRYQRIDMRRIHGFLRLVWNDLEIRVKLSDDSEYPQATELCPARRRWKRSCNFLKTREHKRPCNVLVNAGILSLTHIMGKHKSKNVVVTRDSGFRGVLIALKSVGA